MLRLRTPADQSILCMPGMRVVECRARCYTNSWVVGSLFGRMSRKMAVVSPALAVVLSLGLPDVSAESGPSTPAAVELRADLHAFRVVTQDSGPINYYTI